MTRRSAEDKHRKKRRRASRPVGEDLRFRPTPQGSIASWLQDSLAEAEVCPEAEARLLNGRLGYGTYGISPRTTPSLAAEDCSCGGARPWQPAASPSLRATLSRHDPKLEPYGC